MRKEVWMALAVVLVLVAGLCVWKITDRHNRKADFAAAKVQIENFARVHNLPRSDGSVKVGDATVSVLDDGCEVFVWWTEVHIERWGVTLVYFTRPGVELGHFLDFLLEYEGEKKCLAPRDSFEMEGKTEHVVRISNIKDISWSLHFLKKINPIETVNITVAFWNNPWMSGAKEERYIEWLLSGKPKR